MSTQRTVCHRCGATVVRYEFSNVKVNIATFETLKLMALWCPACKGVLCCECAGLDFEEGCLSGYGFCPVCKKGNELATEEHMRAPMSPLLKKPPPQEDSPGQSGDQSRPAPGSLAYFFVVTQYPNPKDSDVANYYITQVAKACGLDVTSDHFRAKLVDGKLSVYFGTDAVDRGQLIAWASEVFGEEFKAISTKYDLTFSRFDHASYEDQILVARHR